ncbi:MAG: hypothetical protein U5J83_09495, partial [Bryobacterales bacterium]|nr:hypothetical protein [Bryobacterales bacterium]
MTTGSSRAPNRACSSGWSTSFCQPAQGFYDQIFRDLGLATNPVRWARDRQSAGSSLQASGGRESDIVKQAAVLQLINAYRVRGHLIADLDPLGETPAYHPELEPSTYGLTIWDLDRQFLTGTLGRLEGETRQLRLRENSGNARPRLL